MERFKEHADQPSIIWKHQTLSYQELINKVEEAAVFLAGNKIKPGQVIALTGDFTPNTIALMLALINNENIIVPFNAPIKEGESGKTAIAQVQFNIIVDVDTDIYILEELPFGGINNFYQSMHQTNSPGLVLFTSGTSGVPKAAVHNFAKLLHKFKAVRRSYRTINFLLFDHWGGLNTLFHTLSNCGVVLALKNRKPEAVCEFIQNYKIELLPVSPSFLNLLILSEIYKKFDLSSLQLITYGTEPMPLHTLQKAKSLFPKVNFQQTYGLIELGVLRSKSRDDNSLWVKLGGDGFELRVVDDILQIKADSAMLGYLNAPSPFTDDGYFITGDQVEVDGEYFKILGRVSEIINVGGDKVYPQEVENQILKMDNVQEVTVFGEKHALMGNIVCAKVILTQPEDIKLFTRRLKQFCKDKMQPFKIPIKVKIEDSPLFNDRFKKTRNFN